MRIRTKLYLGGVVSALFLSTLVWLSFYFSTLINQTIKQEEFATELVEVTTELSFLSEEYITNHLPRMEDQWESRFDSIMALLENEDVSTNLETIRTDLYSLNRSFIELKSNFALRESLIAENGTQNEIEQTIAYEGRLAGIMRLTSAKIIAGALKIAEISRQEASAIQQRATYLISMFSGLLVVAIGIFVFFMARNITRPIEALTKGAEIIGEGDLDHRIQIISNDETGFLSQAFNKMAEKRQQAVAELRESEELLRKSQEMAHVGSWNLDLASNRLTWSDEVYRMFGLQPQEFGATYEAFIETVHPDDRAAVDDAYSGSLREGRDTYEIEHRIIRHDNQEVRFVHEKCGHIKDASGQIIRSVGMVQDITEHKRTEKELRTHRDDLGKLVAARTNALEEANKDLDDFAYVVSHDLKAPLRGISQLSSWLCEDYADQLDEEGVNNLNMLIQRAGHMHNLIDGILQYSRAGRLKGKEERVPLTPLVQTTIDLLAPPAHIKVVIEEVLPDVFVDPTRLRQVFQNLLSNAIKFMDKPEGLIRVGCEDDDPMWRFYVADNGPGIEEKYFEKIFQIFQTLAPVMNSDSTGIGLTLVKRIIERAGGTVWVESIVGQGATFFFTLPKEVAS